MIDPCRLLVADTEDGSQTLVVLEPADDQHSFISGTGRVVDQYIVSSRVTVSDQSVELDGVVVSIAPIGLAELQRRRPPVEFAALGSVDHMIA